MALRSTIYRARLQIADMDRGYYADHALTLACHPSETEERMMVRLLAWGLHAHDGHPPLAFGKGLSDTEDPDILQKTLTGEIALWVDVGLPDEKRLRKACGRAARVWLYAYGTRVNLWWRKAAETLQRCDNLGVIQWPAEGTRALAAMAASNMALSITVQEGQVLVADGARSVSLEPTALKAPAL